MPLSLSRQLKEIVEEEREQRAAGELPEDAPAPIMKAKTFKQLGTRTAQAEVLAEQRPELTDDELRAKAQLERTRLAATGKGDAQPKSAPSFDSLLGRQLEIRWRYYVQDAPRGRAGDAASTSGARERWWRCGGQEGDEEVVEVQLTTAVGRRVG